jgi:hypothetical protein
MCIASESIEKYSMHKFNQGTRHEARKGFLRRLGPQHLEERLNEIWDVQSHTGKNPCILVFVGILTLLGYSQETVSDYVSPSEGVPGGKTLKMRVQLLNPGDTTP